MERILDSHVEGENISSAHAALIIVYRCFGIEVPPQSKPIENWMDVINCLNKSGLRIRFETGSNLHSIHLAFIQKSSPIIVSWHDSNILGENETFSVIQRIDEKELALIVPNKVGTQVVSWQDFTERWSAGGSERAFLMLSPSLTKTQ